MEKVIELVQGSGEKSKQELGLDYGMLAYGASNEVYVQLDQWALGQVGKQKNNIQETVDGVTIQTGSLVGAAKWTNGEVITDTSNPKGIGIGINLDSVSYKNGITKLTTSFSAVLTDMTTNKIISAVVDTMEMELEIKDGLPQLKEGSIYNTSSYSEDNYGGAASIDFTQSLISKTDLSEDYDMTVAGGKYYYDSSSALGNFAEGKTVEQVNALTTNDKGRLDECSGCTVEANGMLNSLKEAATYSQKDVITDKVQEGAPSVSFTNISKANIFRAGYFTTVKVDSKGVLTLDLNIVSYTANDTYTITGCRADVCQYKFKVVEK